MNKIAEVVKSGARLVGGLIAALATKPAARRTAGLVSPEDLVALGRGKAISVMSVGGRVEVKVFNTSAPESLVHVALGVLDGKLNPAKMVSMLPEDKLRATRRAIGASYRDMADLVGLAGSNANDRLIEMEEGRRPVSGPMERALDYIAQGVDLEGGDLANVIMARYLPAFVELRLPDSLVAAHDEDFEAILHTRYPRFYAVFTELLPVAMRERLASEDLEQLEMPTSTGLGKMVAVPIDRHHGSLKPLMAMAAKLIPTP